MSDIRKVRETYSKENPGDWEDWPYPTVTIESEVSGELRAGILAKLGRSKGDVCLVESEVSGGWSEWTQETDYEISVEIDGEKVWGDEYSPSKESALAAFLEWVGKKE